MTEEPPVSDGAPQKTNISSLHTQQYITVSQWHINATQEGIITTEDKVRLCLNEHLRHMEKKQAWIAPLGILLTIVLTLITTDFKGALGLDASTWRALFIVAAILCAFWLASAVWQALHSVESDDIVEMLKKGSAH